MTESVKNRPLVSIVIISYNRKDALRRCVQAARAQTYPNTEILIVDNDSADGGWQRIQTEFPDVQIIRMHRNVGWPMAKNIASANVRGEFIYFLDDDLYLQDDAVETAIDILVRRPELILVSGQMQDVKTGEPFKLSIWGNSDVMPEERYTTAIYGGHAAWRADGLRKVGYYPEHSPYGGLDAFIGEQALDLGYLIYWSPAILGRHEKSVLGRDDPRNFQQGFLNRIHRAWALHPLLYAVAGTLVPLWRYGKSAIKQGLFGAYLRAVPKIPVAVLRGLMKRRPVAWSTMRLQQAMRDHAPRTPEELKRLCRPGHPVWETCKRVLDGDKSNR